MTKPRAVGADAVNLIGFETTYGIPPDGGAGGVYYRVPLRQYGLSPERTPEEDPTWNRGTPDAGDPVEGPVVVNDSMTLPMCARSMGVALRAVLGVPDSDETEVDSGIFEHVFASGEDLPSFSSQTGHPKLTAAKWRTVHGVKAGGMNFDMARTGRALVEIPLVGQGEIKDGTVGGSATVAADAGNTGNGVLTLADPAFAAGAAAGDYRVVCTAAAAGGGTFEVLDTDDEQIGTVDVGDAFDGPVKFTIADGAADFEVGDEFTITLHPLAARDAAPIMLAYLPFDNARGAITVGGGAIANVTAARFSFSNALEAVETIRADGMIDGVDEGERMATGTVDVRFGADTTLEDLADGKTPAAMELSFTLRSHPGWSLKFQLPRVFFFNPKLPINGPGGISQSWQWRAAHDTTLGYLLGVVLTNDVESY
ncbi:MAG TPA: phage tail tube protein [Devosiaceae bacterium]|jgi:hypothetical protein|nr:phage tail tube protein [Devosiaceae bacterium]